MSSVLLENYIRGFLSESAINLDDHRKIEDAVSRLSSELSSRGLSLEDLDFDPDVLCKLRDGQKLPGEKTPNTSGMIPVFKPDYAKNTSARDRDVENYLGRHGLGFNPIDALKHKSKVYVNVINSFKDSLQPYINSKQSNLKSDKKHDFLEKTLKFKEAVDAAGLKVLGAGVYRVVVEDPSSNNVVIKIGLSDKGRKDCKNEIEFSMGRGRSRREHTANFPTIFHYDKDNGAWYAIEKVLFFDNDTFNNAPPKFFTDIEKQFTGTYRFFEKLLDICRVSEEEKKVLVKVDIFELYIKCMFDFKKGQIKAAHEEQKPQSSKSKLSKAFDSLLSSIKSAIGSANIRVYKGADKEAFNRLFKENLVTFTDVLVSHITKDMTTMKRIRTYMRITNKLPIAIDEDIQILATELQNLFDHAVLNKLEDLHLGNVGFKEMPDGKNPKGSWQLIFTDIDSWLDRLKDNNLMKKNILKSYIRSILLESINLDDHNLIKDTIARLETAMSKRGLDLYNLNFDAQKIVFLRDQHAVKDDSNTNYATKPNTIGKNPFRLDSKKIEDFDMNDITKSKNMPALGFNPFKMLSSNKPYYMNKLKSLRDIYYNNGITSGSDFLDDIISLKEAVDEVGIKTLGSGIFRVAFEIPGNDSFVIKIGLSEKGRRDNKSEVSFSLGNTFKQSDVDNFPTIYTHDNSGKYAWYAIERVKFLSVETLSDAEIISDVKEQFKYTNTFFENTGLINYLDESELFYKYFAYLFAFTPGEINKAQVNYINKINNLRAEDEKSKALIKRLLLKLKRLFSNNTEDFKSAKDLLGKHYESPEIKISDKIFMTRFQSFLYYTVHEIIKKNGASINTKSIQDLVKWVDAVARMDKSLIRLISGEAMSLFEQAIMTDMKDLHAGNIGFKHGKNGKWRLIFTDMDSKT